MIILHGVKIFICECPMIGQLELNEIDFKFASGIHFSIFIPHETACKRKKHGLVSPSGSECPFKSHVGAILLNLHVLKLQCD